MKLTKRQTKGSKLTIEEMDENLTYLESEAQKYWEADGETGIRPKNGKLVRREYIDGIGIDVVVTTHSKLVALRDASDLIVGQNYLISDFAQSYNIFDGGTMDIIEEQIGEAEPIIVTASKVNKLYKVAISTVYPQDIIYYSLDILDIRDIGFGNGVDTINANFKGQIYYRKDTIQNVETHYDFRNVKFRRWAVDAELYEDGVYATYTGQVSGMTTDVTLTADTIGVIGNTISLLGDGVKTIQHLVDLWNNSNYPNTVTLTASDMAQTQIPDAGTYITLDGGEGGVNPIAYVAKDVCKSGVDGKIYKCITATTGEGDPTVNTADWILWLDITADAFVSPTSAAATLAYLGEITPTNLIINNTTENVDYKDYKTFGEYYNRVHNVHFDKVDFELTIPYLGFSSSLNNNVIKTIDSSDTCYNVFLNANNNGNTIVGKIYNITAFANFTGNISYGLFRSNSLGEGFMFNVLNADYFLNNSILDIFGNIVSGPFTDNNINRGGFCNNNIKGAYFNIFNAKFEGNTIYYFAYNTFKHKVINTDFQAATHVRESTYDCVIYSDKTDHLKLTYMDGGVMQIVDVTA